MSKDQMVIFKNSSVSPPKSNYDFTEYQDPDPTDVKIPPMPHRMKSNLTFQQKVKTGLNLEIK